MKILLIDPFSGIAGDMLTGALVNLGLNQEEFLTELNKLNLEGCRVTLDLISKNGIRAHKFNVITPQGIEGPGGLFKPAGKKFSQALGKQSFVQEVKKQDHHHSHRSLQEVLKIIKNSALDEKVKEMACRVFTELGKAEAFIHDSTLEKVHFHEVGAADAIYDICAVCLAIHLHGVEKIVCRPIAVGGGVVKTAHGLLPVPAPATAKLIEGLPTKVGPAQKELTTPTGAAILKAVCDEFSGGADGILLGTGYGAGTLDFPTHANVVKVTLLEDQSKSQDKLHECDKVIVMQCNIDDMAGEILSSLIPILLENKALDVTCTPCLMKKSRQAFVIEVLCHEEHFQQLSEILLRQTTTFGLRYQQWQRLKLRREFISLETQYGDITAKAGYIGDELIKISPEFSDCEAVAQRLKIPVTQIYSAVHAAALPLLKKN